MNGILDSVMAGAQGFRPQNVTEYTALQLARKLGDPGKFSKYLSLVNQHGLSLVVEAFISMQTRDIEEVEVVTAFEVELASLTTKEDDDAL